MSPKFGPSSSGLGLPGVIPCLWLFLDDLCTLLGFSLPFGLLVRLRHLNARRGICRFFEFLTVTGQRISEAFGLRWEHLRLGRPRGSRSENSSTEASAAS